MAIPNPSNRPPWWLWPNLLALDAPAVAVVWQRFLTDRFGVAIPSATTVVLGLTVWGIYLADRWLDARRDPAVHTTDRHRFAARHSRCFAAASAAVLIVAVVLAAFTLPPAILLTGTGLGVVVAGYSVVVHGRGLPLGKELLVGTLFGVGVVLPLAVADPASWPSWLPAGVGFAGLCVGNCALIDVWESEARIGTLPVLAAVVTSGFLASCESGVAVALIAGWVGLAALHLARSRLSARQLRVLADAVLLMPLPVGLLP